MDHFDEDVEKKMQVCIYGLHKKNKIMVWTLTFYNACQKDVHRLDTDFNLNL